METINGDGEAKELHEAQAHIWSHTFNYITSMSLRCAVELAIPDIISDNHGKPLPLPELVQALSIPRTKSAYLYRLMRILVHSGFFAVQKVVQHEEEEEEGYVLTPSSKLLLKNREINLSPFVLQMTDPCYVTAFHFMSPWFRGTELTSFVSAHGMEVWSYLSRHSDESTRFNASMASDTQFFMHLLLKDHREIFKGFGALVDVGGGTGTVTKALSKAFPSMRCAVLDLPSVVSDMKGDENVEFIGGDMFDSIPSADIIMLKWILHDWEDEDCVKILKRCREAISKAENGKVVVIEIVMDENNGKYESVKSQLCLDMLMMAVVTGKERNEAQWEKLFLDAGFTSYKMTHGVASRSIIEVFP